MKIYYFDPETGIYQGEDLADEDPLTQSVFRIPEFATTDIPPTYKAGLEAPYYDLNKKNWELRRLRTYRQKKAALICGREENNETYKSRN